MLGKWKHWREEGFLSSFLLHPGPAKKTPHSEKGNGTQFNNNLQFFHCKLSQGAMHFEMHQLLFTPSNPGQLPFYVTSTFACHSSTVDHSRIFLQHLVF